MQWSDIVARPKTKVLRQFAGIWLVFFVGLGVWHAWRGQADLQTWILAALGLGVGSVGLWRPDAIRYIYSGWMIAAFPIGWTVSRVMMGAMFYLLFTPVACLFRLIGRDQLRLRHDDRGRSEWSVKVGASRPEEYFRQF